jgi:hypothetical protein
MAALFIVQFVLPPFFGEQSRVWITAVFFIWTAVGFLVFALRPPKRNALSNFVQTWHEHVSN